jgi:hypothetical protein
MTANASSPSATIRDFSPDLARRGMLADNMLPISAIQPLLNSRYLIKGWLDRGALSVLYGDSNVGKSFLALDMAVHLAAGDNWHGIKVADHTRIPGPVVYVACEGGIGFRNRIAALRTERPDQVAKIERAGSFLLLPVALDLCTSLDGQHLEYIFGNLPELPCMIIIDTLARVMGAGDENTAKDMGVLVANLDRLRNTTGAHVMVIHHCGKDASKGARGSGALRAAADTEIELTRDGQVVSAKTRKQRDLPSGEVFSYQLRSVFIGLDEDGENVSSAVVEPTEAPAKVAPRLKGQALIAMQALGDALTLHGQILHGDDFPATRKCVSLDQWRECCDRHSLSGGESPTSKRTAFHKQKTALHEKGLVRIVDSYVWWCVE